MALRHWIGTLAVVAATTAPVVAQDNNSHSRRPRNNDQQQQQQSQQTEQPRREQPQAQQAAPDRRERAVPRAEARRDDVQRREDVQRRNDVQRREEVRPNVQVRREEPIRRDQQVRREVIAPRAYDVRRWDNGHYGEPLHYRYGYAPRVIRPTVIQVVPYRPYVYRPSWSVGVYYGYEGYYPYGYTPRGYFDPIPGRYYGGVRITGAPRDARVFADGYYVGIVDDFDGIFQHINLEAGPHHIEIQWGGYEPVAFDVMVRPGETITFRADGGTFRY